ncbi:MAG: hypothetical protein CBD18_03810 [Opitutales bacterium TMED158]|nr:MAG: hypothetical protein CBD18_03810 [Opitutales bacterium TMED158]
MNHPPPRILIIDDEISCLDVLKTALTPKDDEWLIERSNNPQQALDSIRSNPPVVVICDYSMPQINGAELLKEVERSHPFVQRFIMAAPDERGLLEAGIGSVFHYLPKPCPASRVVSEIQRSLSIESWLGAERIRRIAESVGTLPCLPPLYSKVMNALESEDCTLDQVAQEIATDLSISAKILQIVNSSYFGFEQEISDISQAVAILGIEIVKNLVLALQVFEEDGPPANQAFADKLWRHSLEVANGAKAIALYETENRKRSEEAYASGLFHDLGKLIMQRADPEKFHSVSAGVGRDGKDPLEAERDAFGCNHTEVGAYLLARWGLPVHVVESAALHHDTAAGSSDSFSTLTAVRVANDLISKSAPIETSDAAKTRQLARWAQVMEGKAPDKGTPAVESGEPDPSPSPNAAATIAGPSPPGRSNDRSQTLPSGRAPFLPNQHPARDPRMFAYAIFGGFCATLCIGFGLFLFTNRDPYKNITAAAYETDSVAATDAAGDTSAFDSQKSPPEQTRALGLNEQGFTEAEAIAAASTAPEEGATSTGQAPIDSRDLFPKIRVSGIFYNLPKPAASVNGRILRVGDTVSGVRIVSIEKENVVMQFDTEQRSFSLNQ